MMTNRQQIKIHLVILIMSSTNYSLKIKTPILRADNADSILGQEQNLRKLRN